MRILHISPYFPSLEANHAGGLCMGKELEALRRRHQVYVLTFAASDYDRKLWEACRGNAHIRGVPLGRFRRIIHAALAPWLPNYFAVRSSLRFTLLLIYMVRKYKIHAVHAEYASMGQYVWIKKLFPGLAFNLVEHDVTVQSYERQRENSSGLRRIYLGLQLKLVERAERAYCRKADTLFAFNEKDRKLLAQHYRRRDCLVLNPYYGLDDAMLAGEADRSGEKEDAICFLGQMGRPENHQAAMELIGMARKVKRRIPGLQVYIVGNQPAEELCRQASDWIHVTGFVEDVDVYLREAKLAVFPLRQGAGIKLKVLRSLAAGTPVITTAVGAEGIDENGQVIRLAETSGEFEQQIESWLGDEAGRRQLGQKSREYVREHFGWKASEEVLERVYG